MLTGNTYSQQFTQFSKNFYTTKLINSLYNSKYTRQRVTSKIKKSRLNHYGTGLSLPKILCLLIDLHRQAVISRHCRLTDG